MKISIVYGPAASGKSALAQKLLASQQNVVVIDDVIREANTMQLSVNYSDVPSFSRFAEIEDLTPCKLITLYAELLLEADSADKLLVTTKDVDFANEIVESIETYCDLTGHELEMLTFDASNTVSRH